MDTQTKAVTLIMNTTRDTLLGLRNMRSLVVWLPRGRLWGDTSTFGCSHTGKAALESRRLPEK